MLLLIFFLQYCLWLGNGSMHRMLEIKKQLKLQIEQNKKLQAENEVLLVQIKRLQLHPEATETRARSELGMIKKGETFYQIVK